MAETVFFWKGKWQVLINATLSGSAHGGRGVPELCGGGWLPLSLLIVALLLSSLHFEVSLLVLYLCFNVL